MGNAPATKAHGRPLSCTPVRAGKLLRAVAAGNYIKTACNYAGVPYNTARNWVRIGEQEVEAMRPAYDAKGQDVGEWLALWLDEHPAGAYEPQAKAFTAKAPAGWDKFRWPCVVFSALLVKAEAQAEARAVGNVVAAGANSWQAAMTYLERKYPERWGRRDRMSLEGGPAGSTPVQVQQVPSTDDLLGKIMTLAAQAPARRADEGGENDGQLALGQ